LNDLPVSITGETEVAGGKLALQSRLSLPPAMQKEGLGQFITAPLTGTVEQPKIDLAAMAPGTSPQRLAEAVDQHIFELRSRKKESLLQRSEAQVKSITPPFDDIIRATSQPTTQPTTRPVFLLPDIR